MPNVNDLVRLAERMSPDELAVMIQIAEGIAAGWEAYGPLDIEHDERDWLDEVAEEDRDALVYLGAELIRRTRASVEMRTKARR